MTRNSPGGLLVIELGERPGVATCGSLLSDLGVMVFIVERAGIDRRADSKMRHRASIVAGKKSLGVDLNNDKDLILLQRLIACSDAVLISSDFDGAWPDKSLAQSTTHQWYAISPHAVPLDLSPDSPFRTF